MQPRASSYSFFTPFLFVLFVQVIMLVTLGYNAFSLTAFESGSLQHLPPMSFLYGALDAAWISAGRSTAHILTAITNTVIAVMCIWYALSRKIKIVRYVTLSVGLQFLVSAGVNASIAGIIIYGSGWHVAALICALLMAVTAVATAVTFVLVFDRLKALGTAHDAYVESLMRGDRDE